MERLLILGKEESTFDSRRLKSHLLKQGFQASVADWSDLDHIEEGKGRFLLVLFYSGENGRLGDCLEKVRQKAVCREVPIIALIQERQVKEIESVKGLDDFVVEPWIPLQVEARIRFVLSRLNHVTPGTGKRVGGLELNVDRYEVLLDGEPLELTYKEFELLKFLATHPGRVFSRDQLLNQVWGYNFIGGTRTVDVHVRRLRAKLGPKHASLIDTVRNVGYKFLESL